MGRASRDPPAPGAAPRAPYGSRAALGRTRAPHPRRNPRARAWRHRQDTPGDPPSPSADRVAATGARPPTAALRQREPPCDHGDSTLAPLTGRSAPPVATFTPAQTEQQQCQLRSGWLLQSAIAEVARQAKSRALAAVVRGPEIRQNRASLLARRQLMVGPMQKYQATPAALPDSRSLGCLEARPASVRASCFRPGSSRSRTRGVTAAWAPNQKRRAADAGRRGRSDSRVGKSKGEGALSGRRLRRSSAVGLSFGRWAYWTASEVSRHPMRVSASCRRQLG